MGEEVVSNKWEKSKTEFTVSEFVRRLQPLLKVANPQPQRT